MSFKWYHQIFKTCIYRAYRATDFQAKLLCKGVIKRYIARLSTHDITTLMHERQQLTSVNIKRYIQSEMEEALLTVLTLFILLSVHTVYTDHIADTVYAVNKVYTAHTVYTV